MDRLQELYKRNPDITSWNDEDLYEIYESAKNFYNKYAPFPEKMGPPNKLVINAAKWMFVAEEEINRRKDKGRNEDLELK